MENVKQFAHSRTALQPLQLGDEEGNKASNVYDGNAASWLILRLKSENRDLKYEKDWIEAELQMTKEELESEQRGKEATGKKLETLTMKLEKTVECCVCLSIPRGDRIPVCVNGHITCEVCKRDTCPICSVNTDVYKFSVVALSVADLLETECVNETCTVKQLRTQIGHHEQVCKYTENITCPSMFCDENLSVMNCIDHLKNSCTLGKCDHDWATMVFGTPRSIGLKNGSTNKGTWRYVPYVVSVMGDNIIMVGDNLGDLVLISFKCLSADRSKRYSLELKLVDGKTGQSKNNQGQTLLMSETLEAGMEDGNVLELHSKTFKKYQEGGRMKLVVTVEPFLPSVQDNIIPESSSNADQGEENDAIVKGEGEKEDSEYAGHIRGVEQHQPFGSGRKRNAPRTQREKNKKRK